MREAIMKQIYVKPERCMGCRSCEIACAVQHSKDKNIFSAVLQSPLPKKRLFVESYGHLRMPVLCRHCEEAPCLNACVSGCLYRDDKGFVRRHKDRCVGCWTCIMMCPFGVMTRDTDSHIALKCDRCHKLEVPACVTSCPTKTLVLVETDDIPSQKRRELMLAATGLEG